MRYLLFVCSLFLLCSFSYAQEEFLLGKSANALPQKAAVISAEYNVFAFQNFRSRRIGIDLAYGISDRFTLSARGSASDLATANIDLETGSVTAIYQIGKKADTLRRWAFAPFIQASIISRSGVMPADVNLDTHSSGISAGFIVNRNMENLTVSSSLAYARQSIPRLIEGILDGSAWVFQLSAIKTSDLIFEKNRYQLGIMGELMGQTSDNIGKDNLDLFNAGNYLDLLAGLQLTANNKYHVEMAVQTELFGNLQRFSEGLYHIRLKYLVW